MSCRSFGSWLQDEGMLLPFLHRASVLPNPLDNTKHCPVALVKFFLRNFCRPVAQPVHHLHQKLMLMRPGFTSSKRPFQQLAQRLFIHTTFFLTKGWGRDEWKPPQQLHPSFLLHVFFTKHTFRSSSLRRSLSHGAESSMYTPRISLKAEP